MNFSKATPAERAPRVRMVSASAQLLIAIGRGIKHGPISADTDVASEEFVDAVIAVNEES